MAATGSKTRELIWKDYELAQPEKGADLESWCEETSERYGVSVRVVRRVVTDRLETSLGASQRNYVQRNAEIIADSIGATIAAACDAVAEALEANRSRMVYGPAGLPLMKPNGELQTFNTPDWGTRLKAADVIFKLRGSYAPQQLNVEAHHTITDLSDAQLEHRFHQLIAFASKLRSAGGPDGTLAVGAGDHGAAGDQGPVVLDEPLHQDEGRARPDESVQAIPGLAVLPADLDSARERARALLREKPHGDGLVARFGMGGLEDVYQAGDKGRIPERG